jgi:hypothetical protein
MAKEFFTKAALGAPGADELGNGSWLIQDVAGHGLMQSIQAAAAPQAETSYDASAKPKPLTL